ncbi:hypothetical protein J132_06792 [Termitomyces sp. J132]|nr:hypothetical protein J132_06792 [Termitomyces sp. J132]
MSSPSVPVVPPADLDEVVVYNSGGEEFERRRRASVRDRSLVHGGGGGFSGGSEMDQVSSHVAKEKGGVFGGVPSERSLSPPAPIPLIMEVFLRKQVEALTTSLATEKEAMERERNTLVHVATERALEVRGLRERLTQMEGQPVGEAEGWGQALEGDALWVELEVARQREDWLANEAASGRAGILRELSPVPPFVTDSSFSGFRLGAGASGPLGQCLHGVRVDSGWVDTGVRSPASGVAAGDGATGEVVGGASAMQCGGPGIVVGGGG